MDLIQRDRAISDNLRTHIYGPAMRVKERIADKILVMDMSMNYPALEWFH